MFLALGPLETDVLWQPTENGFDVSSTVYNRFVNVQFGNAS